ncbi:MAG: 30S ribosomal protein S1 [Deltaproteobacteria bacterium]|nr:30S ribosomal protein S1 [Deltaproteobacteria bacterium]
MRKPPVRNYRQAYAYSIPQLLPQPQHRYIDPSVRVPDDSAFVAGGESFAELFEASLKSPRKAVARKDPELGELVQGEIVQIGAEFAFLDIGGKAEAMISLEELRGDDGNLTVQIGDKLEGHIISVGGKEGGLVISGKLQKGAGLNDQLRQAFQQGVPVQGLATGMNKGGLEIDLGGVRAFLPSSQIELRYCQDPSIYLGRALTLRVTRFDEESRTVVVSRRAVLEVEQRALSEQTRQQVQLGARFNGVVVSMQEQTALVDIGGLDATVPMNELHASVRAMGRSEESLKVGQRVEVEVTKIEEVAAGNDHWHHSFQGNLRIGASVKALRADPLDEALATLVEGARVEGRVVRLEQFGAFVELSQGVEGLIHISAMAERHIVHPRDILTLGQSISSTVITLDRERRRIGLSLIEEVRAAQAAVALTLAAGTQQKVRVDRVETNGVIVRVLVPTVVEASYPRGLLSNSELNVPRGSDIKKLFPAGRELVAVVQSVDAEGRVRLSLRAQVEASAAEALPPPAVAEAVVVAASVADAAPNSDEAVKPAAAAKPKAVRAKKATAVDAVTDGAAVAGVESKVADAPKAKPRARVSKVAAAGDGESPAKETPASGKSSKATAAASATVSAADVTATVAVATEGAAKLRAPRKRSVTAAATAAEPPAETVQAAGEIKKRVRKSA